MIKPITQQTHISQQPIPHGIFSQNLQLFLSFARYKESAVWNHSHEPLKNRIICASPPRAQPPETFHASEIYGKGGPNDIQNKYVWWFAKTVEETKNILSAEKFNIEDVLQDIGEKRHTFAIETKSEDSENFGQRRDLSISFIVI